MNRLTTPSQRAIHRVALFCLLLLPLACRQADVAPLSPESVPFLLKFSPGDSFEYDGVLISEFGYYLPSSRSRARQRITRTGGVLDGFTDVVTVLDSTVLLRDTTAIVQEFLLAQSANGDLYRFGLLADLARMIRIPVPPRRWDRMALFSGGAGASWVVGYLDSAQRKMVSGSFSGIGEMVSANVNGVQNMFSTYNIQLAGEGISYKFRMSGAPSAFPEYILEPGDSTRGVQYTLSDIRVRTQ